MPKTFADRNVRVEKLFPQINLLMKIINYEKLKFKRGGKPSKENKIKLRENLAISQLNVNCIYLPNGNVLK